MAHHHPQNPRPRSPSPRTPRFRRPKVSRRRHQAAHPGSSRLLPAAIERIRRTQRRPHPLRRRRRRSPQNHRRHRPPERLPRIIKSKSMVSEEIELTPDLEKAGLDVVETDLGEFIVQISHDRPSHLVAPSSIRIARPSAKPSATISGPRTPTTRRTLTTTGPSCTSATNFAAPIWG